MGVMTSRSDSDVRDTDDGRGDTLDLGALWAALKRRKAWIIGPTLAALGLSFVVVNLIPPRYTAEARILLENRDSFYTRPGQSAAESTGQQFDSEAVQSQVQLIMSRDLARDAIRATGLVGNPEFDSGAGTAGLLRRIGVLIGLGAHPADRSPEERVLEKYYERLLVYPVGRSRIVAIEFTSRDPALAAKGANAIAAAYLELQEAAKQDTARSASTWLSTTIDPLRKRVGEAEAKVEDFRSRNGLLVGANNTTITAQQLGDISTQLSSARAQQAEAQAKARVIRDAMKAGRTFEIPDVANNELVRRLIEQRVTLRAQIALESRTLLPGHPRIKEINAQLADLESQIRAAAERTVRTLENEARIAGQRVDSFNAALEGQKKNVSTANDKDVQLRALEREARTLRDQLEQLMLRYREAVARDTHNATPADARVISRAIEPIEPSFPKKIPIIVVTTLATFLVSLATIVSRELLNGGPSGPPHSGSARRSPGWVGGGGAAAPPVPPSGDQRRERVLGLLTHAGRVGQVSVARDDPDAAVKALSERMAPSASGKAPLAVLLDGAGPGAMNARDLAELLAKRRRCILVDLASEDETEEPGFSELLAGEAQFSEIIMRAPGSRLHHIRAGFAGRRAVLAAPDIVELALDALCETYDWVLVATASGDDSAVLAPLVSRAQGAFVIAGTIGNGHAVEAAYRLSDLTQAPVALLVETPDAAAPVARRLPDEVLA